jgi:hypothetical protein
MKNIVMIIQQASLARSKFQHPLKEDQNPTRLDYGLKQPFSTKAPPPRPRRSSRSSSSPKWGFSGYTPTKTGDSVDTLLLKLGSEDTLPTKLYPLLFGVQF